MTFCFRALALPLMLFAFACSDDNSSGSGQQETITFASCSEPSIQPDSFTGTSVSTRSSETLNLTSFGKCDSAQGEITGTVDGDTQECTGGTVNVVCGGESDVCEVNLDCSFNCANQDAQESIDSFFGIAEEQSVRACLDNQSGTCDCDPAGTLTVEVS